MFNLQLPHNLLSKSVGKEHAPPMHVGKRSWLGISHAGKGMLGLGAMASLPLMKQAYQLHQFKSQLRKM
jgi:hypothetical protein